MRDYLWHFRYAHFLFSPQIKWLRYPGWTAVYNLSDCVSARVSFPVVMLLRSQIAATTLMLLCYNYWLSWLGKMAKTMKITSKLVETEISLSKQKAVQTVLEFKLIVKIAVFSVSVCVVCVWCACVCVCVVFCSLWTDSRLTVMTCLGDLWQESDSTSPPLPQRPI